MPRSSLLPAIGALVAFAAPQLALAADDSKPPRNAAGEAELAEMLEGRTMGEPQRCLRDSQRQNMQIVDRTAFVFRDGDMIYVNRPNGANFLDGFDVPVFRLFGSSLCRLDQVELRGRVSDMGGPVVVMNDFVPYRQDSSDSQKEQDQ
jgi:hypothetical protein